jgi:DNA-binding transcriptional MerR regulator
MTTKVTLGRLARETGLARASLLNYEALGLLVPAERSAAGYRLYGPTEIERLQLIRRYREAGLSLTAICELCLHAQRRHTAPAALLENRLLDLSREIERLRVQQRLLARLLASPQFLDVKLRASKRQWTRMLQQAGFTENEMRMWHECFETDAPSEHRAFLKSLGLGQAEIAAIRRWSKAQASERSRRSKN